MFTNTPSVQAAPTHYYKGAQPDTPADTSGISDSLLVDENKAVEVNRATLRKALHDLFPVSNTAVQDLSPHDTEIFRSVVETLRLLFHSPALYDMLLKDVREVFTQDQVRPGTVGAFFRGCFIDNDFNGPLGCSPKCADSLPPPEGIPGHQQSDDLVLIYREGDFHSLNERVSLHCYVYLEDATFNHFTAANIAKLHDAGIEQATIIYGNSDGSYQRVVGPLALDALPVAPSTATEDNYNGALTVIGISVAVLVIIVLIMLANRNMSQ